MIRNFGDHAANERTFLAWVRTAIAVMAFGFLVEKFGLFLQIAAASAGTQSPRFAGHRFGEIAGLALMVLGIAMVATSTVRFLKTAREIDDASQHAGAGSRLDVALAVLLFLLGCSLFAYLASNLFDAP